jgi:hypothetical protein
MFPGPFSQLVQVLSAGAFWCAVAQSADAYFAVTRTGMVASPVGYGGIRYAGVAGGETVIVSHGRRWPPPPKRDDHYYEDDLHRDITRQRAGEADTRVRVAMPLSKSTVTSTIPGSRASDGFVIVENDWWYATLDDEDGAGATTFVKSDGTRKTHIRPSSAQNHAWWLVPIQGEEPRVLEITAAGADTVIREVDWRGEQRSWQLREVSLPRPLLTAELLPDGRIALFSNEAGLSMYLLADDGSARMVVLRNLLIRQFDTAIDDAGRIAIVAARKDEAAIDAVVADPTSLGNAQWNSLDHAAVVTGNLRELQVAAAKNGFVAAWINDREGRRIEATELDARGRRGPVAEVGQASPRGREVFFEMQPLHEELLFWWDDGEHLVHRRLPLSLAGYALMRDLTQRFCGAEAPHD